VRAISLVFVVFCVGCVGAGDRENSPIAVGAGAPSVQAGPGRSSAILFVERRFTEPTDVPVHVGARFVAFSGMSESALPDLLGTPLVQGDATGCAYRSDAVAETVNTNAEARLLDVGVLEVRAGNQALELEPKRFPDIWHVVSGVIYAADEDIPGETWRFVAGGNPASRVGAFEVEARSPEPLSNLVLADQGYGPSFTVQIPRRAFFLRWTRGNHEDTVSITFESSNLSGERGTPITCSAKDDGLLMIDSVWADRIVDLAGNASEIQTIVRRQRSLPFTIPQVDSATLVFDWSVRGTARTD